MHDRLVAPLTMKVPSSVPVLGARRRTPAAGVAMLGCLLAVTVDACANRGMQAPDPTGEVGAGGAGRGGVGSGGANGGSAGSGSGGAASGGGGIAGAAAGRGGSSGSSGTTGNGGTVATGGTTGAGGATATGGTTGAGGSASGGAIGTGGRAGVGGTTATGGGSGTGGAAGAAGAAGTTGNTGGASGAGGGGGRGSGGSAGTSGGAGAGGAAGAGGNVCPLGGVLDCSSSGALKLADGHVADLSSAEWNGSTAKWCDADGLRGNVFAYAGPSPSAATGTVDTNAQNLKLNLTVGATGYAGGGLRFDSCVNASSFTSVQFTAAMTAGSLTGCAWQVQLQTQDQRSSSDTNPSGGTCVPTSTCDRYPAVTGLTFPTATASTYRETFTLFNNPAGSTISTPSQVTGVQWQVNSASNGAGTCTVELRIDNIVFR